MWKLAAAAAVLLAAAGWIWWKVRHNRRVARDRIEYVRACCDSVPADETIFVLLRCAPGDHECGWSLFSLFELAHCPLRVFVSIVEDPGAAAEPALDQFQRVAVRSRLSARMAADHVRGGGMAGYGGEAFIMHLDSRVVLRPRWDQRLASEQRQRPRSVLSQFPTPIEYQYSHVGVRSRTVMRSQLLQHHTERRDPPDTPRPCFGCVASHARSGEVPALSLRTAEGAPRRALPALFWSSYLSFGPAAALRGVEYPPTPCLREHGMVVGAQLFHQGWELTQPSSCVGQVLDDLAPELAPRTPASAWGHLFAKHTPYGQYIGLEADFIRVRAWMGLGPEPSDEEILAKYGSFAAYINLRKSMTGETEIMCGQ